MSLGNKGSRLLVALGLLTALACGKREAGPAYSDAGDTGAPVTAPATAEAKPQPLRNRPPAYPWLARMQGWEGAVVLQVRVEPDGRASEVIVETSSGRSALDRAAQEAVAGWAFVPARRGGRPAASVVRVPVRFRLTEEAPHEP